VAMGEVLAAPHTFDRVHFGSPPSGVHRAAVGGSIVQVPPPLLRAIDALPGGL